MSSTGASDSATVLWSGLQNSLEYAESDTLILLDCCAAASSISGTGSAVTEVIAACGFETWAPGVGEHSFTRSLIDELKYWGRDHTLSVATLHNKVLSRIKYWKPRFGAYLSESPFPCVGKYLNSKTRWFKELGLPLFPVDALRHISPIAFQPRTALLTL